jgi:hypothetical protein
MHVAGCPRKRFFRSHAYQTRGYRGPGQNQVAVIKNALVRWTWRSASRR